MSVLMPRSLLMLVTLAVIAPGRDGPPASQPATTQPACYVGPIQVRVLNPDGTPAVNVPVGIFGGTWHVPPGETGAKWLGRARTDAAGEFRRDRERECIFPTIYYAFDEPRQRAGFAIVDTPDELARTQIVRLTAARRVVFEIGSEELSARGGRPAWVCATIAPLHKSLCDRCLRFAAEGQHTIHFLLPPEAYMLSVQGDRLEAREGQRVDVAAGDATLTLPRINLPLSAKARLIGKPAPPLDVAEWCGPAPRPADRPEGAPAVLCFWAKSADPQSTIPEMLRMAQRLRGSPIAYAAIHHPEPGGFKSLKQFLEELRASNASAEWPADLCNWPMPVGIDARLDKPGLPDWKAGRSAAPFGSFASPYSF